MTIEVSEGTNITIRGRGFSSPATVTIGGTPATNIVLVDSETITCDAPANSEGIYDVLVTSGGATSRERSAVAYAATATYTGWDPGGFPGASFTFTDSNFTITRDGEGSDTTNLYSHLTTRSSGKYDLRFNYTSDGASTGSPAVGFYQTGQATGSYLGQNAFGWSVWANATTFAQESAYHNGVETIFGGVAGASGEIMIALDADLGHMWVGYDGVWMNSGNPETGANPLYTNLNVPSLTLATDMYYPDSSITLLQPNQFVTPVTPGFIAGWPD